MRRDIEVTYHIPRDKLLEFRIFCVLHGGQVVRERQRKPAEIDPFWEELGKDLHIHKEVRDGEEKDPTS